MNRKYLIVMAIGLIVSAAAQAQVPARGRAPAVLNFNPDISVVIDGIFYGHSGDEELLPALEDLRGFSMGDAGDDDEEGFEAGFNLRHLELVFEADVDPYFRGWAIIGVDPDGAELEEAVIQTTALPWGLQLKLGKFFSDYSRLNAQHAHDWNFADAPLITELLFGDHGLNEKGVQLSWLAPTPFYLNLGAEVLQGENDHAFDHLAEGPLPERDGPRAFTGWLRAAPNLYGFHATEFGIFAAHGVHQEQRIEDDQEIRGFFDGHQTFWGADFVYKYAPPRSYGHGAITVEGGYVARRKDLDLVADEEEMPGSGSLVQKQDGIYLQGIYGFAPRWRAGLRAEVLGLTNRQRNPDGSRESFDQSYRGTAMIDWTLTEFSRMRLQGAYGRYDLDDGKENIGEVFLQAVFSLGTHGAHKF